ncbi:MAG: nucleoside-diphosphate kinase, partial [Terriglobales bacterium]
MPTERTLTIVKPDAVAANRTGAILAQLEQAGFRILGMRRLQLTRAQAEAFYAVHRERGFY